MPKIKIAIVAVVAVLLLVVILQNRESVSAKLLFVTITMPLAVHLFITALVGYIIGLLTAMSLKRPKPTEP